MLTSTQETTTETVNSTGPIARSFARRFGDQPAWAIVTEVFIGLGWLRAATTKIIDPTWWSGDYLGGFVAEHAGTTLDWYAPFLEAFVSPNLVAVSAAVLVLQLLVAASLLSGRARGFGLGFGMAMNLHFVAAGAVNPSAFYLLAQGALLLWMLERWRASERRALLPAVAAGGLAVAGFNLPFIGTIHPAEVIDDPAIMFMTLGSLTALAAVVALSQDRAASAD